MTNCKNFARSALLACLALSACRVGPNYVRPGPIASSTYKEAALFRPAAPADAIDRGAWWALFGDPDLDRLAEQVAIANQDVLVAEATYRQELGLVREQRAALFPTVGVSAGYSRSGSLGTSGGTILPGTGVPGTGTGTGTGGTGTGTGLGTNPGFGTNPGTGTGTGTGTGVGTGTGTTTTFISNGGASNRFNFGASASWAPDVFGGTRRGLESVRRSAEASAADLANMRLSLQGSLVLDYLQMRSFDAERGVLDATIVAYRRDLEITNNRYKVGVAGKTDVLQAETQLLNAQVSSADLMRQRGILEHAVAVLAGRAPGNLAIARRANWQPVTPTPPPGIPSALLERRPDIAAAERRVAAANARIGVAVAAFYPNITLSASSSQSAGSLGSLFSTGANIWSLGGNIAQTLLDFGARKARVAQARAVYDQTVAQYRSTTLVAFRQVEDFLLGVRLLNDEYGLQSRSAAASSEAEQLTRNQYKAGQVSFTNVIVAETTALSARRAAIQAGYARQASAAQLIQALGGGWTVANAAPPVRPVR